MQENRKKAKKEDSWICTSAHLGDILNFKGFHINVIYGET
jgi:hypothetical protein